MESFHDLWVFDTQTLAWDELLPEHNVRGVVRGTSAAALGVDPSALPLRCRCCARLAAIQLAGALARARAFARPCASVLARVLACSRARVLVSAVMVPQPLRSLANIARHPPSSRALARG